MATPRNRTVDPTKTGIYHCWSRCVRRASLFGDDKLTGNNYDHRRDWIEQRVAELAAEFAIDVLFFAIMQNHFHLVLRNLPELVRKWSDTEVLERSIRIYPTKFKELGVVDGKPTAEQRRNFVKDRKLMKELRLRLSHPSWFMRQLKQHIARRANGEDEVTGAFFEGRYKCRRILDEAGVLICGVYVDLNQIRAGEADRISKSCRTSGCRRMKGLAARRRQQSAAHWDSFLCPLSTTGDGQLRKQGYPKAGAAGGLRASDTGVLEMTLEQYLKTLDWAGRQLQRGKQGKIADDAPTILEELGLDGKGLVTMVEEFEELFSTAVGTAESLARHALEVGRNWLCGAKRIPSGQTR